MKIKLKPLILMMACISAAGISNAEETDNNFTDNTNSSEPKENTPVLSTIVVGASQKAGGDLLKQPLSASVITEQQIKDDAAKKLDAALFYEAGILSQSQGLDNKSQWFKVRGFEASQTLDGTALAPNGFFVWEPEIYGLERLEIIKGSNSFNYGATKSGGNVNLVSKRPTQTPQGEFNLSAGNLDQREVSADYSGLLNQDGSLRYRLVGLYRQADSMMDGAYMKHYYFAPSLAWDISDKTNLTILTSYLKKDGVPTAGFLPIWGTVIDTPYGKIDRNTNVAEPETDRLKLEQVSAGYEFSHQFDHDLTFAQNFRYGHMNNYLTGAFVYSSDNDRTGNRGYSHTDGTSDTYSIDNRLIKEFALGDVQNKVMIGVDYQKNKTDGLNNGFGLAPAIDLFDPVHTPDYPKTAALYTQDTKQLGFYLSNQLNWNDLIEVNLGIRQDKAEGESQQGTIYYRYDEDKTSYNAGILYHAPYGVSPYASYSTSFQPAIGIDGYGRGYQPYEGEQYEVGLKYAPTWVDGEITLAYFDLTEKNALVSDSSNISVQAGKRTNKGIELQANLNVTEHLSTQLAYTHNHSEQELSATDTIRTPAIPNNQFSAKLQYLFLGDHPFNGLRLGTGVRYIGSSDDQQYYPGYTVDSYTLVDVMASYPLNEQLDLQLNATNLTDKEYVSSCSFYCFYGASRSVDMRVSYKW